MANQSSINVYSELYPNWTQDEKGTVYDEDFWNIIDFFVLHSLCEGQSCKNYSLQSTYNWKENPWYQASYLKDKIYAKIWNDNEKLFYMAGTRKEFAETITDKNLDENFTNDINTQRVGIVKVNKGKNGNEIMSMFYHIRNGFAHGRYGLKKLKGNDYMIYIEDGSIKKEKFEITARIAIKKSSMLAIRELIINGPDVEPDYETEIIDLIKQGFTQKNKIIKKLKISDKTWDKTSKSLKAKKIIKYSRNKWELC